MDISDLNEAQRKAVEELDKNILLLAPAGTGKTNTLACRIAGILENQRALPEEILCLTFTNKACREMRQRVEEKAGEAGSRVLVRTFHGFCYDVIKAEAKRHSDLFSDFILFDETDSKAILKEILEEVWPLRAVLNLVAQLKEKRAEYHFFGDSDKEDYQKTLARLMETAAAEVRSLAVDDTYRYYEQLYQGWQDWGPGVAAEYDQRIHELHGLDFTDLIMRAGELFSQPELALRWARRFVYINIDEVQDTSELEYDIISRIFGSSHLLLCGDYFQTIYEWRGSHPELVLRKFQQDYHPCRIVLHENYRSTQVLLRASFASLQELFPERVSALYPEGITAVRAERGEPIVFKGAMDFPEEAQWIYYTIQQLPVRDYSRVCILTRSNRYNKDLSAQFRSLGRLQPEGQRLPFMLIDEMKFFRRQEVKDVLAFLRLIVNKHDVASFVRILNRFGQGIGPATIRKLSAEEYRRAGIRLTDFLDPFARRDGDPFALLMSAWEQENLVVFDVEATGVDTTRDEIIQIAGIRLAKDGTIKEEFQRVLRPTRRVGDSVRVHKMTDEWLQANGDDPAEVLRDFCSFAEGAVIVGHNVTYDLSILGSHLSRLNLPAFSYPAYYDTLDIFRRFYPNLPSYKLEYLGEYCHVSHKSSHDALDDIKATAEILQYVMEREIRSRQEERRQLLAAWMDKFADLAALLDGFRERALVLRPWQLLGEIVVEAGISDYYQQHKELQRVENLRDLFRQARDLDDKAISPLDAVTRFLRFTTLSNTELDALTQKPQIPIITVHQAKGSEFDYVFLAGMQEGTFPGFQADKSGRLAEEARLFYVAITRAKRQLFVSWTQQQYGHYRHMSRFLATIPREYVRNE